MKFLFFSLLFVMFVISGFSQTIDTIYIWPDKVPGEMVSKHPAKITGNHSGDVTRLTDITNPLMAVYHPESTQQNASIIICPGGSYKILAIDKEGYEIAEWFHKLGITAYVLQYRVPNNKAGALQDIQRAIRLVRKIDGDQKIGVIGFSAGASLSARASTLSHKESYMAVDDADQLSSKPDFAALIYPGGLDLGEDRKLTPELEISEKTPPIFIFGTADDIHSNSCLVMTTAMRDQNRPVELHLLAEGGHGYGMRKGNVAGETWPVLLETWLNRQISEE